MNRLLEAGVHVPEWKEIEDGLRPEGLGVSEWEPCEGRGWQRHASATMHDHYREEVVWPHFSSAERGMVRSQSGPLASVSFTALPIHRISRMDPYPFRVLLLTRGRRLEVVAEGLCFRRVPGFRCHRRLHASRRWNTQGKKKQRGHVS